MSKPITMYSTAICPYCIQAKKLLAQKGLTFSEVAVDKEPEKRQEMMERSGRRTVPQIWVGDVHVGGFTDLWALEQAGGLDKLLNTP